VNKSATTPAEVGLAEPVPDPRPWLRRPGEGERAFAAFVVYRDMPCPTRSLRAAAEVVGKDVTLLKRWSARHQWVSRVDALVRSLDARQLAQKRQHSHDNIRIELNRKWAADLDRTEKYEREDCLRQELRSEKARLRYRAIGGWGRKPPR